MDASEIGLLKKFWLNHVLTRFKVRHVYGKRRINYARDELIVVTLAKNAGQHIDSFLDHYIGLGVKHIIILDNNSADDTIARASTYPKVSIFNCSLPFRELNVLMRQHLIRRFGKKNRWVLCVDIDELFDYPHSDQMSLSAFLQYLEANSFTAVVAYLLDMFSDRPLSGLKATVTNLKDEFPYYDISSVRKLDYLNSYPYSGYSNRFQRDVQLHNTLPNSEIMHYVGGIRAQLFNLPDVYLIKHPLIFMDGKVEYVHQHFVDHASIADVTGVLYHYKFVGGFAAKVDDAIANKQYAEDSGEYQHYRQVLDKHPHLSLKTDSAAKLNNVNDLVQGKFLQETEQYLDWISSHKH